jgi:hypothetical protein
MTALQGLQHPTIDGDRGVLSGWVRHHIVNIHENWNSDDSDSPGTVGQHRHANALYVHWRSGVNTDGIATLNHSMRMP